MTAIATPSELQKAEEFLALTRFREVSDQLTGTLEPAVQDPPDFLITDGSRRASVEMTRYLQRAGKRGFRGRTDPYAMRLAMNSAGCSAARREHRWPRAGFATPRDRQRPPWRAGCAGMGHP